MSNKPLATLVALASAALLSACGGSDDKQPSDPGPAPSRFTKSVSWTFTLPEPGHSLCFDFDQEVEVPSCMGTGWDLEVASGGRSATLWTNSGTSGPGQGGAFGGPFDHSWGALLGWGDATIDPVDGAMPDAVYFKDSVSGAFSSDNAIQSAAFEYDLQDDHQLYPNYRVFLITTDGDSDDVIGTAAAPVFALQVTGYYGGPTGVASGHVSFRWVNRAAPDTVHEATVDATSDSQWVYFDLASGAEVDESGNWHIAFSRYSIKLNGGDSGLGSVAGFVGKTPAGFYDASGQPVIARFTSATPADTLADLTADDMNAPATARNWLADAYQSPLNPDYRGSYPNALDFGWYSYYPSDAAAASVGLSQHMLKANPEAAALIRSGEGNSYARLHVTSIEYAPAEPAYHGAQTWTIEFDVQPAP